MQNGLMELMWKSGHISGSSAAYVEQRYPFPQEDFQKSLVQYMNVKMVIWWQEEPKNQGAWYSTQHRIRRVLNEHFPGNMAGVLWQRSLCGGGNRLPWITSQQKHFVNEALNM